MVLDSEEIYTRFTKIIENVNVTIATYQIEGTGMPDVQLDPRQGTVAFGSAYHGYNVTWLTVSKNFTNRIL